MQTVEKFVKSMGDQMDYTIAVDVSGEAQGTGIGGGDGDGGGMGCVRVLAFCPEAGHACRWTYGR